MHFVRELSKYCRRLGAATRKNFVATSWTSSEPRCLAVAMQTGGRRWLSTDREQHIVRSPYPDVPLPLQSIPEYVWGNIDRWPDKIALECGVTGRRYTYAQLRTRTRQWASLLASSGLRPGDVLAIALPNVPEYAEVLLGGLEAGLVISTLNPGYTADEMRNQLSDCAAKCMVTLKELQPIVKLAAGRIPVLLTSEDLPEVGTSQTIFASTPQKVAVLPYSSGTTGIPKGVMLSHCNVVHNCMQLTGCPELVVTEHTTATFQEVIPAVLPFFHIYGMVLILLSKLAAGAKVVTLPKFEPKVFINTLTQHKATILFLVPPLVLFLASSPDVVKEHFNSVHCIMSGAAPISESDVGKLLDKTGPGVSYIQGYGLTETSPAVFLLEKGDPLISSVGKLIPNTEAKVLSTETGKELGSGSVGEVCVRGPQVMQGYLNKPEATIQTIDKNGWLHTGDLGFYDPDGHFYIVDRLKELIKVKAFQVAPAELEALLRTHPAIEEAAVIGVPDEKSGEVPRAFVVPKPSATNTLTEKEVQNFVAEKLSKHKHLTGGVKIVDNVPKSPSGKILRKLLKNL